MKYIGTALVILTLAGLLLYRGHVVDEVNVAIADCVEAKATLDNFQGTPEAKWNYYSPKCI